MRKVGFLYFMYIFLVFLLPTYALAQVSDGQAVNASVTNGAFLYKNSDTTALGKVNLNNSSDPSVSGSEIFNIQRELNSISSFTGKPINQSITYTPSWSNNDVGTSTDSVKARADSITAKFNSSTGHKHTGAAGDAPQISLTTAVSGTLPVSNGGTGQTTLTAHGVLFGNGTSAVNSGSSGSAGQVLQSGGASADPTYSTPTYPSASGSAGKILRSDGTNNLYSSSTYPDTVSLGDILYGSASNVLTPLSGNTTTTKKFLTQTGNGSVSAAPAWNTIAGSDLPNPSASTLGGIQSYASVSHQWINTISTSGVPSSTQPAFSDISGTASLTSQVTGVLPRANGGTGISSATTDGQIPIGSTSGGGWTAATITAGSNITVTNGSGSITIAGSGAATPAFTMTSQTSTLNPAVVGTHYYLSGASFTVTLPDATTAGNIGKPIIFEHAGTSLSQKYTLNTTSAQTIGGVASGSYILTTNPEILMIESDGSNWRIIEHKTKSNGWTTISGGISNETTFTVTSASSTLAAVYVPAYQFTVTSASATATATYTPTEVFTITAGNTASVGAIYSSGGNNCTLVKALLVGDTTAVFTCAIAPAAAPSTLTYVSGTHTGGNISYSAFSGGINSPTLTVASTIASATTLYLTAPTGSIPGSGQLAKVSGTGDAIIVYSALAGESTTNKTCVTSLTIASLTSLPMTCYTLNPAGSSGWLAKSSGTGDTIITYSAQSGGPSIISATTTPPAFNNTTTSNFFKWKRDGERIILWVGIRWTVAGVAGSGDYLLPMPSGALIDTTAVTAYTGGSVQADQSEISLTMINLSGYRASGFGSLDAGNYFKNPVTIAYSGSYYRIYAEYAGGGNLLPWGSTYMTASNGTSQMAFQAEFPVSDWQP